LDFVLVGPVGVEKVEVPQHAAGASEEGAWRCGRCGWWLPWRCVASGGACRQVVVVRYLYRQSEEGREKTGALETRKRRGSYRTSSVLGTALHTGPTSHCPVAFESVVRGSRIQAQQSHAVDARVTPSNSLPERQSLECCSTSRITHVQRAGR
jgi:hypothetical protein